ncbi:MAG: ABC transporter ATP-binding protein, partial [Verrucomicrobia bacterium]|nr:ABC transporter ATP-binding protein [Verrucomicrobiota bacterium]
MNESQTTEPAIQIDGLVKIFRDFWRRPKVRAVNGISLSVESGQVFGLLGPNGSGKSTTLKILLGLLFPTSGQVHVLGRGPRHVATKQAIGYLPEESYLYKYLTPRETLDFYGRLFGLDRADRRSRIDQLLTMVGLQHAADRPVGDLSKGMA